MMNMAVIRLRAFRKSLSAFTLIELLVVMAIIAILASFVISAGFGVIQKGLRSRAASEIQAMSAALEGYKADNGIYPNQNVATGFAMSSSTLGTNSASAPYFSTTLDGTSTAYKQTSQVLYLALSGQTNFADTPVVGAKVYMSFKANQVGDPTGTVTGASYVQDPWGYSYGYSIGTATSYPYSGNGFFDLWSTGGLLVAKANTNAWLSNWQ